MQGDTARGHPDGSAFGGTGYTFHGRSDEVLNVSGNRVGTEEIEAAMERAKTKDDKKCQCDDEDRAFQSKDQELQLKEREAGVEVTKQKNQVELDQAKANVAKTKKETTELGKEKPAAAGSSSSK